MVAEVCFLKNLRQKVFALNVLLNLSIQFLATRDKILAIDHHVTEN